MQNPWYLFVVYGLVWVGIFFYARRFSRRQKDLELEADRLGDTSMDKSLQMGYNSSESGETRFF